MASRDLFAAIWEAGGDFDVYGIRWMPEEVHRRFWGFFLCPFDGRLSLARVLRCKKLEMALSNDLTILAVFHDALALMAKRDVDLMVDFSSASRTYLDRPLPSIDTQLKAIDITGNIRIVAFNIQDAHPAILLDFAVALFRSPGLLSRMATATAYVPPDKIWRLDKHSSTLVDPTHPVQGP
jgi:hypothetical protein